MGTIIYNFLSESPLFDDNYIDSKYSKLTEKEILKELERYRQFYLKNLPNISKEIRNDPTETKIFTHTKTPSPFLLKQWALYLEQVIVNDPMFKHTSPEHGPSRAFSKYLGIKNTPLNRHAIAHDASYYKLITPMVVADYVKLFPLKILAEPPKEIPIKYSENAFFDELPQKILNIFRDNANVKTCQITPDGMIPQSHLELCRSILIQFEGYHEPGIIRQLYKTEKVDVAGENQDNMRMKMTLPDTLPSHELFNHWVSQSINEAAVSIFRDIMEHIKISNSFNARYLTHSELVDKLLKTTFSDETGIKDEIVNTFINAKLPLLDKLDTDILMKIRSEDGEAFENFRIDLEKRFKEIRLIEDPELLKKKVNEINHELEVVQLHQINTKIKELKKKKIINFALAAASLTGVVQTSGFSLISFIIASLSGVKSYNQYRTQVKENPIYFLWKTMNR